MYFFVFLNALFVHPIVFKGIYICFFYPIPACYLSLLSDLKALIMIEGKMRRVFDEQCFREFSGYLNQNIKFD